MNPVVVGGVLELGKALVEKLIRDPEAKAKAQLDLIAMQQAGELKVLEASMSAIVAEANSADPWTSRARPSFLYVMYVLLLSALPMGVLHTLNPDAAVSVSQGFKLWLEAIPEEMWWLFGTGYLGYSGARMFEKRKGASR